MMDYLKYSQEVRKEIIASGELLQSLKNHLSGEDKLELISSGRNNRIYRVGRLENGLFVALRHHIYAGFNGRTTETPMGAYESYCQNAERLEYECKRVSIFCIGVKHKGNVGLLVEDFTRGGEREIEVSNTDVLWVSNPLEEIHIDIEDHCGFFGDYMFMNDDNMIDLD
ncbi:hypothetical protein GOV12_04830 [Candidatus Pacearchaeota archaeon]|nr:hypothetical protein [Candidatus Pacearchaeota archaeon]